MIRKNIFIILTVSAMIGFFSNTVLSAQYRIGVPKNHVAAPYKWFFNSLAGKNPAIAKDLTIVEIDLEGYRDSAGREKIRRDIAEKCDLFFSTGDDLNIIFEVGITSPLLFFSISDLTASIPESMRKNTTGIYRESKAELFKQLMQILPEDQRKRIGMIYCRGGKLEKLMFNFMQLSEKMGVELITKSFSDSSDIGRVMQEFKQEKATAVMLLPPALCSEQDLIEIIAWQKKLSLPVIGQIKEQIKQGILGGPAMDSKQIGPNLADYATKILRGRNPHQLPIKFFGAKYVVNLNTASQLGTIIPQAIIEQAEIVGMANHNKVIEKNNISPVAGNFTIGVPANLPAPLLKSLLQALEDRGYFLEMNLRLVHYEISKDSSAAQLKKLGQELSAKTDLIFTNGTNLILLKKIPTISSPICFISTQELITDIPPSLKKNFTGVIRASVLSLMDMIQQMMPGKQRVTVMSHSATNLPETESEYRN
ncbi:MAG: hypothetical protein OEY01_15515, partial [Desulfobulbaceae bacterium]|nr:hypothetical protein [Desulfobulbaceae bacterium]HIJ79975.1 hypothetical protein [Deltaproteobacteria bacterium]